MGSSSSRPCGTCDGDGDVLSRYVTVTEYGRQWARPVFVTCPACRGSGQATA